MRLLAPIGFWLWLVIITLGSLLPAQQLPPSELSDKHSHLIAYAVLAFLALATWLRPPVWRILLGVIGYGILIELLQSLTATRQLEGLDIVANTLGAMLGALLFRLLGTPRRPLSP